MNKEDSQITFSPEDIELLRISAEEARRLIGRLGGRHKSYQETRYEFAKQWAEGNHWNSKKTIAWAARIKREVTELTRRAKPAAPAAGTTSGSACGSGSS